MSPTRWSSAGIECRAAPVSPRCASPRRWPHDDVTLLGVAGRHRHLPTSRGRRRSRSPICPSASAGCTSRGCASNGRRSSARPDRSTSLTRRRLIPCATDAPLVVTLHDLAFLHDPSHFTRRGNSVFRRSLDTSAGEPIWCCAAARRRWTTVSSAGSRRRSAAARAARRRGDEAPTPTRSPASRSLYRLPERYLLFVGTVEPRKNLRGLVAGGRVAGRAAAVDRRRAPKVGATSTSRRTATSRFLGFVPADDLGGLYAGAEVFCYPSEREGYGLPVLEAMAQGTPGGHQPWHGDRGDRRRRGGAGRPARPGRHRTRHRRGRAPRARVLATEGSPAPISATWAQDRAADRATRTGSSSLMVEPRVAVNLLWCVPGDVGGSEEYLVRQLLGLAEQRSRRLPRDALRRRRLCRGASATSPSCSRPSSPRSTERRVPDGSPARPHGSRRHTADADLRPPRRWHRTDVGRSPICADHSRPAVPDVPRVLQSSQADVPRSHDRQVRAEGTRGGRTQRVRPRLGDRGVRRRPGVRARGTARLRARTAASDHRRGRVTASVLARRRAGDRVSGGHRSPQESQVPDRYAVPQLDATPTCGLSSSAGAVPPRREVRSCDRPADHAGSAVSRPRIATGCSAWPRRWSSRASTKASVHR